MTKSFFYAAFLYMLFVIYGSLVPLDYKDIPLNNALNQFKNIPYLDLGMESRADWIANILLYIPLAFLGLATFKNIRHPVSRSIITLIILCFCLSLAVSIEFAQLFFPPRTVSLNDLLAETIGTVLGVLLWHVYGQYFIKLYGQLSLGSFLSVKAAIVFYILTYLSLGFFPFDFMTSFSELEIKLASGNAQLLLSTDFCREDVISCIVKLGVETLVLTPLGYLICLLPYLSHKLLINILLGFFIGFFSEIIQLFLVSGVAEGMSVLTRMMGMSLGYFLFNWSSKQKLSSLTRWLRPMVLYSMVPYFFLVLSINGWTKGPWITMNQAVEKLANTQFLPFYYFYYTTETIALISLLSNIGTYIPLGMAYWAWFYTQPTAKKIGGVTVGLSAVGFAFIIETGKLFLADKHADPTDIIIAFAAASGAYAFLNSLEQTLSRDRKVKVDTIPFTQTSADTNNITHSVQQLGFLHPSKTTVRFEITKNSWIALILVIIIGWALVKYPSGSFWLTGFLFAYSYLLFRLPQSWLIVLPALLPVMDFTPWTGRIFFDEFDLVILTTLAVYFWQKPYHPGTPLFSKLTTILLWFFSIFYFISLLKGLLPLSSIDANSFSNYYSNYNSLRVGKGVIWGLLLAPLLKQAIQRHEGLATLYFGAGILLGLSAVVVFSIVERFVFTGLFDFTSDYRINALFSSMHTGGGHIESYLSLALPFITLLFFNSSHTLITSCYGIGLFITGLYVLLVTFSRGGYIGCIVSFFVLLIGLAVSHKGKLLANWQRFLQVFLLIAIAPMVAFPVLQGTFIQERFHSFNQDSGIRSSHWQDAVNMMDNNLTTALFGMGVGAYPRTYSWLNSENVSPATYKIESEKGNIYLSLRGGDALYFGQYINTSPHTHYRLMIDVRSKVNGLTLTIPVCEKSLQYSFRCSTTTLNVKSSADHEWQHVEQMIDTGDLGIKSGSIAEKLFNRPVQLALYNSNGTGKLVDIDNISLSDSSGRNLIDNGDFSNSTDFWFFSTEKHHPWHILNLWVHILFDQGWLGVICFLLLLVNAIYNLCRNIRNNPDSAIFLASLSGFIVIGLVDSPFDAPRLTLFFALLLFFSLAKVRQKV